MARRGTNLFNISDRLVDDLKSYLVGFVDLTPRGMPLGLSSLGSGTFVQLGGRKGILTAAHVLDNLPQPGEKLGLLLFARPSAVQSQKVDIDLTTRLYHPRWRERGKFADIGFLGLPGATASDLEAKGAVFFNLGLPRKFESEHASPDLEYAYFTGVVDATKSSRPLSRMAAATSFEALVGACKSPRKPRSNHNELFLRPEFSADRTWPSSFGGTSGGGVWSLIFHRQKDSDEINVARKLIGVTYRQGRASTEGRRRLTALDAPWIYDDMLPLIGALP